MKNYLPLPGLEEGKDFSSSLCVQTSSEAHPASYPMATGVIFSVYFATLEKCTNVIDTKIARQFLPFSGTNLLLLYLNSKR
jgi:hypothetical protein